MITGFIFRALSSVTDMQSVPTDNCIETAHRICEKRDKRYSLRKDLYCCEMGAKMARTNSDLRNDPLRGEGRALKYRATECVG